MRSLCRLTALLSSLGGVQRVMIWLRYSSGVKLVHSVYLSAGLDVLVAPTAGDPADGVSASIGVVLSG